MLIASIYKHLKEKLQLLWSKDLHVNTVHVRDLARAIWHVTLQGQSGHVYNVVDDGNTRTYYL